MGRPANAARDAVFLDLAQRGMTAPDIAEEFGVSLSTVSQISKRLGIKLRRKNARAVPAREKRARLARTELDCRFRELAASGRTADEICVVLGVCRATVDNTKRRLGIKLKRKPYVSPLQCIADPRLPAMAALYRSGKTLLQIGEQYSISRERVRQILTKRLGMRGKDGGHTVSAAADRQRVRAEREQRCLQKYGCSREQIAQTRRAGREMIAAGVSPARTPLGAFVVQRRNADARRIPWNLTFWQWWCIWSDSGKWQERGRSGYVMCRKGDVGAYELGNVFIATSRQNVSDAVRKNDLPMGVRKRGSRFVACRMIAGKVVNLGSYATPDIAHGAYLASLASSERRAA